jgi:uncharacterized damage-inducible protein DinB
MTQATMRLADAATAELEQESAATRRVLERVPENRLDWRPHPKSFSLGQLAYHIASTPAGVARIAAQDGMEAPDFAQRPSATKAEILAAHDESVRVAKEFLRGLDDERAEALWTMTRGRKPIMSMPRIEVVRMIMFRHIYHHRGELCVYLRLLDVPVPSIYGPSADENPFA